jgi:FIST C domain
MEEWNVDLIFHVVEYLNVIDMSKMCRQSKRWYYLIHQYRMLRGPQFVTVASYIGDSKNCSSVGGSRRSTTDSVRSSSTNRRSLQYSDQELYGRAISQLQGPLQLAVAFTTEAAYRSSTTATTANNNNDDDEKLHHILANRNPADTVTLGAIASTIQTTGIHNDTSWHTNLFDNIEPTYECQSNNALMMLSGLSHNTTVQPFLLSSHEYTNPTQIESFVNAHFDTNLDWKMIIVYVVDYGVNIVDTFINCVQSKFSNVTVVGGICTAAYVSLPICREQFQSVEQIMQQYSMNELRSIHAAMGGGGHGGSSSSNSSSIISNADTTHHQLAIHIYNVAHSKQYMIPSLDFVGDDDDAHCNDASGICGVALAGDVPVRSVVSRGVESAISKHGGLCGTPTSSTTFFIHEADVDRVNEEEYFFRGESPRPYHSVRTFRDDATGKVYNASEMIRTFGQPEFLGIRFPNDDGFSLESPHPLSTELDADAFLIIASSGVKDATTLVGTNVDFLNLSGGQCMKDMDYCMEQLHKQTFGEDLLGAIMFSCSGRGPEAGSFITEVMADAKRFAHQFKNVPCIGFYADGEIGPLALAGRESVFQQGNACLQGFTAVFALFIVPRLDWEMIRTLNDSDECINSFMQRRRNKDQRKPIPL